MKKIVSMMGVLVFMLSDVTALAAHPERDWTRCMDFPTEEQLAQQGELRSPYIAFFPGFSGDAGMTAVAMDYRIDHDPVGTYICPVVWNINTSSLAEEYTSVKTDYGEAVSGYFGFQVLEDGTKAVIMSLWNAFCEDEAGNVNQVKGKVLFPEEVGGNDFTPENNGEGSFVQCIYPYEWEVGKDYRFVLEQTTGESGTECYTLWLMEPEGEGREELFCIDSGLKDIWIDDVCGFVENFVPETAAWPRTMEFWNVRGRMRDSGEWENAPFVLFTVNSSEGDEVYEGSWNFGQDERCCWIITSGIHGLCAAPESLGPYPIPATESGAPD